MSQIHCEFSHPHGTGDSFGGAFQRRFRALKLPIRGHALLEWDDVLDAMLERLISQKEAETRSREKLRRLAEEEDEL